MDERESINKYVADNIFSFDPIDFAKKYSFDNVEKAIEIFKSALSDCKTINKYRNLSSQTCISKLTSNAEKVTIMNHSNFMALKVVLDV